MLMSDPSLDENSAGTSVGTILRLFGLHFSIRCVDYPLSTSFRRRYMAEGLRSDALRYHATASFSSCFHRRRMLFSSVILREDLFPHQVFLITTSFSPCFFSRLAFAFMFGPSLDQNLAEICVVTILRLFGLPCIGCVDYPLTTSFPRRYMAEGLRSEALRYHATASFSSCFRGSGGRVQGV